MFIIKNFLLSMHVSIYFLFSLLLARRLWAGATIPGAAKICVVSYRFISPINLKIELDLVLSALKEGYTVVLISDKYQRFFSHEILDVRHPQYLQFLFRALNFVGWTFLIFFGRVLSKNKLFFSDASSFQPSSNGVQNNEDALTSCGRYFRSFDNFNYLHSKKRDFLDVFGRFSDNTALSDQIADHHVGDLDSNGFVFMSHGYYSMYGPFRRKCRSLNVGYVCYGVDGFKHNGVNFSTSTIAAERDDEGRFELFLDAPGTSDLVISRSSEILSNRRRRLGNDFWWNNQSSQLNGGAVQMVEEWVSEQKKQGQTVVSVFPNLVWDNATAFKYNTTIYNDLCSWLSDLPFFAKQVNKLSFVVRGHPVESSSHASIDSAVDYVSEIVSQSPELKDRFLFVTDANYDSFHLVGLSDNVFVFNGTLGLEALALGYNVIFASNAIMARRTGLNVPLTREECLSMLSAKNSPIDSVSSLTLSYLCFYFDHAAHSIPGLDSISSYRGVIHSDKGMTFEHALNALERRPNV